MKRFLYPPRAEWLSLLQRPVLDQAHLRRQVEAMLAEVRQEGDAVALRYAQRFDGFQGGAFAVSAELMALAAQRLSPALRTAIEQAYANIHRFHSSQKEGVQVVETMPGVRCWRQSVAVDRVGLYIPGGTAPLFSTVLMLGVPAQVAGCLQVVLCSPAPSPEALHPAILYAAQLCGIEQVFCLGGVQAIGAMAYGTAQVPKVYKIFGPGNQYVTQAKQCVQQQGVAIDLPAGPSEVAVLADAQAPADWIAADLLAQAEHGSDSQVLLVTDDAVLLDRVEEALARHLQTLPREQFAAAALEHSKMILVESLAQGMELLNDYAPEHLILAVGEEALPALTAQVRNAGSVFMGYHTPESAGDYASGTNHTLPTNGYALAYSGVSLDSFVKKITYQQLSPQGVQALGPTVVEMAKAEALDAHALAMALRMQALKDA
jgi:histidinol dehydrogenase